MNCPNCGKEVASNAKFCGNCGKQFSASIFCGACGAQNSATAGFCIKCGTQIIRNQPDAPPQYVPPIPQHVPPQSQYTPPQPAQPTIANVAPASRPMAVADGISPKSKTTVALLAFFLGQLGIHRFYIGKTGTGIIQLLLTIIGYATLLFVVGYFVLVVLGIWVLIDFIMILMGKVRDKNGLLIK